MSWISFNCKFDELNKLKDEFDKLDKLKDEFHELDVEG